MKPTYSVLVEWPDGWHELLRGPFDLAGAELVASEARRLRAVTASVAKASALRKLYRNLTAKGPVVTP